MTYKIRDGIVMETICGVTLLIATLEASADCPYAVRLNGASAYIWDMLFRGLSFEEMTARTAKDQQLSEEEAGRILQAYIQELARNKYLSIQEEEKANEI